MKYFRKTMVRDTPMIMVEAWSDAFTEAITGFFGISWPEPIFIYNTRSVESWRTTEGFHTTLPVKMSKWAKDKKNLKKFIARVDLYKKTYLTIKKKLRTAKKVSSKQALKEINNIRELFLLGCSGFLAAYWCVTWNDIAAQEGRGEIFDKVLVDKTKKYRKDDAILDDSSSAVYKYLEIIAQNEGWPKHLVFLMSLKELRQVIKKGKQPDFVELKRRLEGYGYFNKRIFTQNAIKINLKKYQYVLEGAEEKLHKASVVSGTIANSGKIKGRVRLIFNRDQMGDVKAGDVLVAPMTTPWYLPAMQKASAFVTDEGGIICHAAIIAREMNKPCVVGTKIATTVFKDGDRVEVDANKGTVRKIK